MEEDKSRLYEDVESASASSETIGFLGNRKPMRQQSGFGTLRNLRLALELSLAALVLFLFASGSVSLPLRKSGPPSYGPVLPRKSVILGNTAALGPDIEYNNQEMLWNETEMKHVHRNWQQLFPSKCPELWVGMWRAALTRAAEGRGYVKLGHDEDFTVLHPPFA